MKSQRENSDDERLAPFDPEQLFLRMAICTAIHEMEEPWRETMEIVFVTMEQKKPLILQDIANRLDIAYATFYERLEKGLYMLAVKLSAEQDIEERLPGISAHIPNPEFKRVPRLVKALRD